jgi:hypothetical protein
MQVFACQLCDIMLKPLSVIDPLDHHTMRPEPRMGPSPERRTGRTSFVVEDLDVGKSAVVVDRGMDVCVAEASTSHGLGAAVNPPAPAGGDPPQLLHIDVDQRPRVGMLVAADHSARLAVEPIETVQAMTDQHPVHRRPGLVDVSGDPIRAPLP